MKLIEFLKKNKYDYVIFADADDVIDQDRVKLTIEYLQKNTIIVNDFNLIDENNKVIGELRSGCYNPTFGQVIGIAMIYKPHFEESKSFKININGTHFDGKVCDLPFI